MREVSSEALVKKRNPIFIGFPFHFYWLMKPLAGFEPATSSLPWKRSTDWAKAALLNHSIYLQKKRTPQVGLEPTTSWLTVMRYYQLSYCGIIESAWQRPTLTKGIPSLPSALRSLTSVFGMGTGVTFLPSSPHNVNRKSVGLSKLDKV